MVPPYCSNFGKRLIKSPKVYWLDSGLACHLLGIETETQLRRSPFAGPLFEGFIASEIIKQQINAGRRREIFYFRDQQGLEVDFLVPSRDGRLNLIEAKATRTVTPAMTHSMTRLASVVPGHAVRSWLVHGGASADYARGVVMPGVTAASVSQLIEALA